MAFEVQTIEAFLEAREAASDFLMEEGIRSTPLPLEDAFILQAASHVLESSRQFYGMQVARLTRLYHTAVYRRLDTFEHRDQLLTSSTESPRGHHRGARRLYSPTEIGSGALDHFQAYW